MPETLTGPIASRQIVLAERPVGWPTDANFRLETASLPAPADGQFLARNIYMSVDPYMRGRMNDAASYVAPFQIGKPLEGGAVARVVESRNPGFAVGDYVMTMNGWRESFLSDGRGANKIDPRLAPISAYLGVLGVPGMTGWYGLKYIGEPKAGETLVVSGAAGATGSLVVQMGKILGLRVVGVAGGEAKCKFLTEELGADVAVDYKKETDLFAALKAACPKGIDIYYENVGGEILDHVLRLANPFARIPFCGMISQYNNTSMGEGPRYMVMVIGKRIKIQGFIVSDHLAKMPEFLTEVGGWLKAGKLKYRETIVEGVENAPRAFLGLLRGENLGKMLVKVGE
jgi:NADPH-dependent curcumin reductase CurA